MCQIDETPFDAVAATYDDSFSQTLIGQQQRLAVRKNIMPILKGKNDLKILEINCGTGDDALWLTSLGHEVMATDASAQMIERAIMKASMVVAPGNVSFLQCPFERLYSLLKGQKFDVIFSNFSGLNCISFGELQILNNDLSSLLKPNGYLAVILFGKYTFWETLYYLVQLDLKQAFRRWSNKAVKVNLSYGITQSVYYYSVGQFQKLMYRFQLVQKRPVGLFVPPSYLENWVVKKPGFFKALNKMELKFSKVPLLSGLSDHTFLLFKNKVR
ncbi:class I SAM-dependent methyltransferase [Chitinophagaceae bacterium LB-8]|uniref:Class I SAM-dependent methyltransferase n=1 Tax=Paraflavisolibacter caeni TaxID=2982496 RepID=A0A9X3BHP8_9BACT|nr:class I SAM-dependent methyltransferase [Paraflavisolibacter caeni]MCU7548978.1 class I SAM-dependent methyltransferase [Paraflavisolibacter caeni]